MTHGTGIKVGDRVRAPGQAAGVVVSVLDMGVLGRTCLSVRLDGGGAGLYEPADLQRESVKIGDTVAWADVPLNTMVRWHWESYGDEYHVKNAARTGRDKSACVGSIQRTWYSADRDGGNFDPVEPVTIIALGLTGSESAADLQRMAEVFDGWRDLVRAAEDRSIEAANEPTWEQP